MSIVIYLFITAFFAYLLWRNKKADHSTYAGMGVKVIIDFVIVIAWLAVTGIYGGIVWW